MGGLAGHMSHLYDNPRLKFSEIKQILQDAAEGNLEGTEKTDGQNLYISFSVPKQELEFAEGGARAARNKTNIKSGGMSAKQLAQKFAFNKSLKKSFSQALRDFENVIKKFPRAKQEEIFGPDTNIYYNAEIINPETANVINYDSKLVSIHRGGGAEFDKETGSPVEVEIVDPETGEVITGPKDVSKHANTLAGELEKIQQDLAGNKFKIEMDAVFKLKALEDKKALNKALSEIEDEISSEGISDSQMVIEYIMARILSMIRERGMAIDEETEKLLLKRVLLSNPSYRAAYGYDKMPKELDPRKIVKGASKKDKNSAIYIIKNADTILKQAIEPIETTIHDFTVEMLKGLESLFVLDNKKETERLRKEVSKAIKAIEKSGHEGALEILQKQMNKLKTIENISTAAEGFVFDHDGWSYKFTGNFAPINQILGLFKYGRKGIPPLENLKESREEEAKRLIVLYPGRFQPMGRHHYEVFTALQKEFGEDSVYIQTSDAKTNKRSPLSFEEKKKVIMKHGVPEDKILKINRPYRTEELEDIFHSDDDIIVFIVGEKDKERLSRGHYLPYENNKNNLETFDNKVYLKTAPHICITLDDGEEMCGSSIRKAMRNLTPQSFKEVMGWFDKDIYEMLKSKINESVTSLSEAIFSIVEEILNEKEDLPFGGGKTFKSKVAWVKKNKPKIKDPEAYVASTLRDMGELDELKTGAEYHYGHDDLAKRKKVYDPSLESDHKSSNTSNKKTATFKDELASDDSEDMELEETSGAGAAGGYSLPLGMKPSYFKSPAPRVKGIRFYNRKKKK